MPDLRLFGGSMSRTVQAYLSSRNAKRLEKILASGIFKGFSDFVSSCLISVELQLDSGELRRPLHHCLFCGAEYASTLNQCPNCHGLLEVGKGPGIEKQSGGGENTDEGASPSEEEAKP